MKNTYAQILIVIVVTTIIVLLSENSNYKQLENIIFMFYLPGELLSMSFLGGIHGAPQWSLYLGILLQNIVIWRIIIFVINYKANEQNT